MVQNDLKFFTNEPERDLYSRFCNILKGHTQFFDILVGYFRTSGFFKLYPAMQDLEKIRILVGLNVDAKTVQIIEQSKQGNLFGGVTIKEATEKFSKAVVDEFADAEPSMSMEQGVRTFIEWLKSGKIEMRMYPDAPIHAKVYILRKDPEHVPDQFGSVITGSSNFSMAGLQNNLEFNVELKDSYDVKFALDKFEELWKQGVDITEAYISTVDDKTWMRGDITPYEIYLKTIYEYFKEEINTDKEELAENILPDGFMRLQYQLDAVIQAKRILEAHDGVFISDVVGLGKTYICSMLAKILKKGRKLVICPPVLVDYWKEVLLEFDVAADVVSLGKLESVLDKADKYKYVFVDEAHRFRNSGTDAFGRLHAICYGKRVVLISATPINNYTSDIENQIYLFQPKHNSNIVGVKNLEEFFLQLRKSQNEAKKQGGAAYLAQISANSEIIRDKLLRHIMIRRTRSEVAKYYAKDMERQGLKFPRLDAPEKIIYEFDELTDGVFTETINAIKDFNYARYKPLTYLKTEAAEPYTQMMVAQQNMGGFMKGILVKRLESSFYAFRLTLGRFVASYEKFIDMFDKGEVYISKKVNVYDLMDNGDDELLLSYIETEDVMHFKASDFRSNFIIDLKRDLQRLCYLQELWKSVKTDPKLIEFEKDLKNVPVLARAKKIVFTESKETAQYLMENLDKIYGERIISYSGDSSAALKKEIEYSFNPKYMDKNRDKYDILITTDVLAEGINLHRSNVIINYDLPWNPTRIMQRVGRINRVGTAFDKIYVFNFFPTSQASKQLPLTDRILEKLQAFHDTLGEDYKFLSEEENPSPQKLFKDLSQTLEEEEGASPELEYLAKIREIRDNDLTLFNKIKSLPKKSKTGRLSDKVQQEATLTFIRKGALKSFFLSEDHDTHEISFMDAMEYLECESNEKKIPVGSIYYDQYKANSKYFDESLTAEDVITTKRAAIRGNDATIVKALKGALASGELTDDQETIAGRIMQAIENGDIPKNTTKEIVKQMKTASNIVAAFAIIRDNIDDTYLYARKNVVRPEGDKEVILSCYMKEQE
ncbi:helicase-related protein [Anaerovibrio lipolyticus]|uniref:helicase-related protein n=1 Tax=Anaerovibrio lipolyticus TaxID=82374 RepID=UPI0025E80749|nr:helicase-related protein [Anaerovibrio lipolyticus]